jgi:hypothetical protein
LAAIHRPGTRDHEGLTRAVMKLVLAGKLNRNPFFSRIPAYFDYSDPSDFWLRVLFFNFLPCSVGGPDQKYARGTSQQAEMARCRFLRLLSEYKPTKVFVFTAKGWNECPDTSGPCVPLNPPAPLPSWGRYAINRRTVLACGFYHPQYATTAETRIAVQRFLKM